MTRPCWIGPAAALLAAALLAPSTAAGQVISATVGIEPKCPYGLGACWPEAQEGLAMMDRVRSVDAKPSLETWTGTVRTEAGVLPDPVAWSRQFKEIVGGTFGFRGVEITVEGELIEDEDGLALKVPGSKPLLRLAPLDRKVQWDPGRQAEREATEEERTAHRRLADRAKRAPAGRPTKLRIVGPMDGDAPAGRPIVTVREFAWL